MIHMVIAGTSVIGHFNYDEPIYMGDLIEANGSFYRVNHKRRLVAESGEVTPVLDTSMAMEMPTNEDSES